MCILFIAIEQHPDYPVIICANRDEFHQRPTKSMHWWQHEHILAGKDLQAGGTWLGLDTSGRFSALTNFRRPSQYDANKPSRGDLVVQALTLPTTMTRQNLNKQSEQYNDFNLVFGPLDNLHAFDSVQKEFTKLTPGFHSISNGALDDTWPKMALGIKELESSIINKLFNIEQLFRLMTNQTTADKQHLPHTGLSEELESLLSSIFIVSAEYGTRSTAIIVQNKLAEIEVYERSYNPQGKAGKQNQFRFSPTELNNS